MRIERQLRESQLRPHVWRRKELESYLIETAPIARLMGAEPAWVDEVLADETAHLKNFVHSRMVSATFSERAERSEDLSSVTERVTEEFDAFWSDPVSRRWRCSAKELIASLNRHAEAAGLSTVTSYGLARGIARDEIAPELGDLLSEIDIAVSR